MIRKQHSWLAFFTALFIMPALQADTPATQYPHNPASSQTIDCISTERLKCFDTSNRQLLWENPAIRAPRGMLIVGEQLIINSDHASIIFDLYSGDEIMRLHNEATLFDPVLADGNLVLSDQQGWIRVINLRSRAEIWRRRIGHSWVYPPAVIDHRLITGGRDGDLSALDLSTGAIVWRKHIGQELVYRPVVAAHKVFASSFDGYLHAFNAQSGDELSRLALASPLFEIKASSNKLFGAGYDGKLYAIDARNNQLLWSRPVADSLRYHFSINQQTIASIDYRGDFNLLDMNSGSPLQHIRFEGRYQIAPLITHSKIWLFPSGKPFFNVPLQKTG